MQSTVSMSSDFKALLTLLLLKTGTSAPEISNALQIALASRMMMQEEYASPRSPSASDQAAGNVASLRPASSIETATARRLRQTADTMNSDIKALLTMLLLKNGASSSEIQTALRMAASSRAASAEEAARGEPVGEPETHPQLETLLTARQVLRNDQLAPISMRGFAA